MISALTSALVALIADSMIVTDLSAAPIDVLTVGMTDSVAVKMVLPVATGVVMTEKADLYGVRSGPRARAAMAGRGNGLRREAAPSRNALITLDADVARVFGTSEAVNAALRHLIALAGIMGEDALKQAAFEAQKKEETPDVEEKVQEEALEPEMPQIQSTDEDEEWFDLPVENGKND